MGRTREKLLLLLAFLIEGKGGGEGLVREIVRFDNVLSIHIVFVKVGWPKEDIFRGELWRILFIAFLQQPY